MTFTYRLIENPRPWTDDRHYEVLSDGHPIGTVTKGTRTWERKIEGRRYVYARGETPCWRNNHDNRTFDTRTQAAKNLADHLDGAFG